MTPPALLTEPVVYSPKKSDRSPESDAWMSTSAAPTRTVDLLQQIREREETVSGGPRALLESIFGAFEDAEQVSTTLIEGVRPSVQEALEDIKSAADLSWEELSELFGVSRRTIHYWRDGAKVSSKNQRRLEALYAEIRDLSRQHSEDPAATRSALMAPSADGPSLFRELVKDVQTKPDKFFDLTDIVGGREVELQPDDIITGYHASGEEL